MSKIDKIFKLKLGIGIVEKRGEAYVRSDPKLLEELNHGDHVFCVESNSFRDMIKGVKELIDFYNSNSDPKIQKKIRIQQLKEELKELENE